MQIQKDNIRKIIIATAREEFIKHGFKGSSMRKIAAKSNVGLSNIYNYFKNKDEIFCEVLNPLLKEFDKLIENHNSDYNINEYVFTIKAYQERMISEFMNIINNFKDDLRLLLFNAGGSSLENFRDTYSDQQTQIGMEYFKLMKKKFPNINANISEFFVHITSSWWITILGEIISHDELSSDNIKQFLAEYIAFGTAGWKQLMNVQTENE